MKVEVIDNQVKWDDWIKANSKYNSFAQSWDWGDILLSEGKKVERLAVVDGDKTVAQAQVVYNKLPFGWEYGFCPKGPAITYHVTHNTYQQKVYNKLIDYLRQKEKFIFFRIESSQKLLCDTCYVLRDTIDINPCATNILDLTKSEEKLLNDMKSKTRYNIRLAERKGLEVSDKKVIDAFVKLSEQTAKRDGFKLHGKKHYEEIADSIISYQLSACLPTCPPKRRKRQVKKDNQIVASNIFIKFGNTFTYLYGASDYKYRNLMAPYLLQWEGIKLGKKLGCKYYDMFGIAPQQGKKSNYEYDLKHQYAGVTRFKLGFGGEINEDPGTFDLIINNGKYFVYKLLRRVRRII